MAEEGHLPPEDDRRTEAATSMEHQALAEVLPTKKDDVKKQHPFISYLVIATLLSFFILL